MNLPALLSTYMDSHSVGLFVAYFATGVGLWALFNYAYLWLTPHDDLDLLAIGNTAVATSLVGAELGFMLPLVVASIYGGGLLGFIMWGVLAGAVQLAVTKFLYWHSPTAIMTNNHGKAICFAGASVCAGILNAISMIP